MAFASRLWPDLIMQPHPVSVVKPWVSRNWLLSRTPSASDESSFFSAFLGIGVKFDLYVIHSRDSKSRMKSSGQSTALVLLVLVCCLLSSTSTGQLEASHIRSTHLVAQVVPH